MEKRSRFKPYYYLTKANMFKKFIFIIPFIILVAEYSFSAAGVDPTSDTNSAISYDSNPAINPVIRVMLDRCLDNLKASNKEGSVTVPEGEVFRQVSPGIAELSFIPLNAVQYQSSDYFPLYSGTLWEYTVNGYLNDTSKVLPKPVNVNGVMTRVVRDKNGLKEYYTNDSGGIMLHRIFQPDVSIPNIGTVDLSVTFIPPLQMAADMISVGQTFESGGKAKTNSLPVVGTMQFTYSSSISIDSMENITVPAGAFDVVKISWSIAIDGDTSSSTLYLAENLGIVKEVSAGYTSELDSVYYINPLSPSDEEEVPSGETYTVNWETTPYTEYFNLMYSTDNGTIWKTITPDLVTGTTYDWNVPPPKKQQEFLSFKDHWL